MTTLQSYQRQQSSSWTRIDMLLALYDFGIQTADAGISAMREGDQSRVVGQRLKLQRFIVELLDGLDPDVRETSEPIQRLMHFVLDSMSTDDANRWSAARRVLASLRDGFAQVREDAVRLEQSGAAASAAATGTLNTLA